MSCPSICAGTLALIGVSALAQTPACVLSSEAGQVVSVPCSIGGTIVLPSQPGGTLFTSGRVSSGKAVLLEEPQNPGFSIPWSGSPYTLSGPLRGSVPGNMTFNSISGAATIVGIKVTATCGVLGSATATTNVSTPGTPLVITCPQVSSSTELPTITTETTFTAVSSATVNISLSVDAPSSTDALLFGGFSAQTSVNSVPTPPAGSPVIFQNGIVPIYSTVPIVEPVSWISIWGTNLANGNATWNGDFPTQLGGVTVTINDQPAYIWYVSPGQLNVQVPSGTVYGAVNAVVNNGSGSTTSTAVLAQTGPSLSLFSSRYPAGVILTPDGSGAYGNGSYDELGPVGAFSFNTRPVKVGETLELFGVGFGPTDPEVPAGQVFSGNAPGVFALSVSIGGTAVTPGYTGMTSAGLFQINLVVPSLSSGDQLIDISVQGVHIQPSIYIPVE